MKPWRAKLRIMLSIAAGPLNKKIMNLIISAPGDYIYGKLYKPSYGFDEDALTRNAS